MSGLFRFQPSGALLRLRRAVRNDQLVAGVLAMALGLSVGVAIIGFREGISFIQTHVFGGSDNVLASVAGQLPWWQVLLVPTAGGLLVGLLYRFLMPGRAPQGIANVMESAAIKDGRMDPGQGMVAAIGSMLSIGAGASVGREGPAVHIGASMAAWMAERLSFGKSMARTLLGCGAAAAVAASFNAPIAGALFAHEVIVGHYAMSAFVPVVISSVTATAVARWWFGNYPAFELPEIHLVSFLEFPAFAGLGVIAAICAIVFMRSIAWGEMAANFTRLPRWVHPALGGFLVGLIALLFPHVLGVGYEVTDNALRGSLALWLIAMLVVAKTMATGISLGFGFGGGVFSPSLAVGALLGGTFGIIATSIFPELSSGSSAYAIVGMGAVASAVIGAPISTTLIIFEMTGNYGLTLAVMVAVVIATAICSQVFGHSSFFHWQLDRRGLDLSRGQEFRLLKAITVHDVFKQNVPKLTMDAPITEVRAMLQKVPYGEVFVVARDGTLFGTITLADLDEAAFDHELDDLVNAADVARQSPPVLAEGDNLETAVQLMLDEGEEHIAVVDNHATMMLIGCVHENDVLLSYNREILRYRAIERGHDEDKASPF